MTRLPVVINLGWLLTEAHPAGTAKTQTQSPTSWPAAHYPEYQGQISHDCSSMLRGHSQSLPTGRSNSLATTRAAIERGCYLEVTSQTERLDLTVIHCRMAKKINPKTKISTDADSIATLDYMRYGI